MPSFHVIYHTKKDPIEAFELLCQVLERGDEITKFDAHATWKKKENTLSGIVSGKQFRAHVEVQPDSQGSNVIFKIEVGLLLMPLKGKISEILTRKLEKYIA
ncbi:MAG: polyhydroxyalkanoic acid system family protein [Bdellovibrionaceae bacterium]|nr:polyhydroxyalkanoic acid system family protein [Pseudobdellovibrionaceae bacterium]MDW8189519.1 hypothetical protein [Pseudobdellovibrionaceae bacterium]